MPPMDLNLLRVFEALIELRSVTRAADRLGLTQSAVSHALSRLRDALGDPLFVRTREGLRPTPRALEVAPGIRDGLSRLRDALTNSPFEPSTATRSFAISAGSYFSVTLLPEMIRLARAEAPGVSFRILAPASELLAALDEGSVDLALGGFGRVPDRLTKVVLLRERLVWIAAAGTDPATIADRPRLSLVTAQRNAGTAQMVSYGGLEQRVTIAAVAGVSAAESCVTVHDPLTAGAMVAASDLVALVPKQLALRERARERIDAFRAEEGGEIEIAMLWHTRLADDPAQRWLRDLVLRGMAALG